MSTTQPAQHSDSDLGFEVEIQTSGRAHDSGRAAPTAPTATLSPTRAAAKAQARRRNLTLLIVGAVGLAILGLWAFLSNPSFNVPSDAVARVNGEYIYNRDVTREIDLARATFELAKSDEQPQSPGQVLETLIDRKLQTQDAKRNGVTVSEQELDTAVKGVLERVGVSGEAMKATLEKYNLTLDDLRLTISDAYLINKYIGTFVAGANSEQDALSRKNEWQTNLALNSRIEYLKSPGTGPAPTVNSEAPDFTLRNLAGEEVKLSELRGKPVMINFWATWCAPCRSEIPEIVKMYRETHANANYEILGVATGNSAIETVKAFAQEFDMRFPLLPDSDNHVTNLFHVLPIPTTFFIDKDGIIRETQIGPVDRAMMEKWLLGK
jgi:peroxiredoxin